MKKILIFLIALVALTSCKDFLYKPALTSLTDETYWSNETSVQTFAWGFYGTIQGYTAQGREYNWFRTANGSNVSNYNPFVVNNSYTRVFNNPSVAYTSSGYWNNCYSYIRRCNLLLERLPEVKDISVNAANHYKGVALFFRAYNYFLLFNTWGGVPLIKTYVDAADEAGMYVERATRAQTVDFIIKDLEDAIPLLQNKGSMEVGKDAAKLLLARVCLYEATWEKYHGVTGSNISTYLNKAVQYSQDLIDNGGYSLKGDDEGFSGYKQKYCSLELQNNPEMIMFRHYQYQINTCNFSQYMFAGSPIPASINKFAVERFACEDGLPWRVSDYNIGDKSIDAVRNGRDHRLLDIFFGDRYAPRLGVGLSYDGVGPDGVTSDQWTSNSGMINTLFSNPTIGYRDPLRVTSQAHIDCPIFTISEAYLIYAEAKAELGTITNADLNKSVNLLRARAGIKPLLTDGTKAFSGDDGTVEINDPDRTSSLETTTLGGVVNPIIFEIRRERMAELFAFTMLNHQDIDRWAKGEYCDSNLNKDVNRGAYLRGQMTKYRKVDNQGKWTGEWLDTPAASITTLNNSLDAEGYWYPWASNISRNPNVWDNKFYLDPIPVDEMTLYKNKGYNLEQNPGWPGLN